ncbi:MAG: EF-hand domain-containing protein [Rhodobacteraceae bacterium]|nr:EF-hand domain-containing protein [Paracoccaceae bacterium]
MRNSTKTTLATAIIVGLIGATAVSASPSKYRGLDFDAVDTNGDGYLTLDEMKAEREKWFDARDADKDGALSAAELKAHRSSRMEKGIPSQMIFEHMDTDKNGSISQQELAAALEKRQEMRAKHAGKYGRNKGGMNHAYGPRRFMERMDDDGDGKISKAEMTGKFIDRIMEHLDADKDNRISKAEAKAGHRMFRKHN